MVRCLRTTAASATVAASIATTNGAALASRTTAAPHAGLYTMAPGRHPSRPALRSACTRKVPIMPATTAAASVMLGFGVNLALLTSLGAQNTFLIRQGLAHRHVGLVAVICIASDAVLISSGITGMARVVATRPWMTTALALCGAGFLYGYAALSARRAWRTSSCLASTPTSGLGSAGRTALAITAITWLNPHVLLETVVVLGTAATSCGVSGQWWFCMGAVTASTVWFLAVGYGIGALRPAFARPVTWQALEGLTAVMMLVLATIVLLSAF